MSGAAVLCSLPARSVWPVGPSFEDTALRARCPIHFFLVERCKLLCTTQPPLAIQIRVCIQRWRDRRHLFILGSPSNTRSSHTIPCMYAVCTTKPSETGVVVVACVACVASCNDLLLRAMRTEIERDALNFAYLMAGLSDLPQTKKRNRNKCTPTTVPVSMASGSARRAAAAIAASPELAPDSMSC